MKKNDALEAEVKDLFKGLKTEEQRSRALLQVIMMNHKKIIHIQVVVDMLLGIKT